MSRQEWKGHFWKHVGQGKGEAALATSPPKPGFSSIVTVSGRGTPDKKPLFLHSERKDLNLRPLSPQNSPDGNNQ